jgi:hypothetical protein
VVLAIGHTLRAHEALSCSDALPGFLEVVHRLFEDGVFICHDRSIRTSGSLRSLDCFAFSRERFDRVLPSYFNGRRVGGPTRRWPLAATRQAWQPKRAARATAGREGPPEAVTIAPEEAKLTDEQWALVCPLLPPQTGTIGAGHPTTTASCSAAYCGWLVPAPPGGGCRRSSVSGRVPTGATSCGWNRVCDSASSKR